MATHWIVLAYVLLLALNVWVLWLIPATPASAVFVAGVLNRSEARAA